ncbi:MAG: M28 family peptidase, partial [bacterium]|nr:M28 family peptidase [bacterium]
MPRTTPILVVVLTAVAACSGPSLDDGLTERLRADIDFLASDKLEGRGTPSPGLDAAADYLEAQLRAADVAPMANGSYRQEYVVGSYSPSDAQVTVRLDGKTVDPANYVFVNIGRDPRPGPIACELVDAGNGMVMEDKNVDDLSALDLRGKAVVARKGAPWPLDPESVYGPDRAIGKVMAATVRGAELLVYLSEDLDSGDVEAGFFAEMKNAAVGFVSDRRLEHPSALSPILVLKPSVWMDAKRIEIAMETEVAEERASNVLGIIEGSDPALGDEWIVLSAHYDHLGFHTVPEGQDGIWNGADDNASGTAAVLELARRLARNPGKRSVLVFFTSGEDRGILGSAFYSLEPVVEMDKVALQLNLDMIGRS